jgi:hypothetical protein
MSNCKACLSEEVCRYNDGHNLYCKEDYYCPHFKNKKEVGKCGNCLYSKPTTFGKSKAYVKCTNPEHIQRYCKREISLKRQRTQPACKSYKAR